MRKTSLVGGLAAAVASMFLVLSPPAVSAQTNGGGGGGSGEVYSDLFVALRDENGVPILSETFYEVGEVDPVAVTCIQPISYDAILSDPSDPDSPYLPSTPNLGPDGPQVYLVPLQGEASLDGGDPVAEDTACAPQTEFQSYASEVELERLNLVRTSDEVLWKKLAEVGTRLATADDITLDGMANSSVPRRSFCIISASPPSWLEPNTTTLALLPSFSLARRANSLADSSNSEPGPPTWPSLSSICAAALTLKAPTRAAVSSRSLGPEANRAAAARWARRPAA